MVLDILFGAVCLDNGIKIEYLVNKLRLEELLSNTDKKVKDLANCVENNEKQQMQLEKTNEQLKIEKVDLKEQLNEALTNKDILMTTNQKLDDANKSLQIELQEYADELNKSGERMRRTMEDASRVAEELGMEHKRSLQQDAGRKRSEATVKMLQVCIFALTFYIMS